jgi:transcriptional regulator with XRE-family HTH domain
MIYAKTGSPIKPRKTKSALSDFGEGNMRFKNNVGPQVRRRRYALGWSQSVLAAKLQIAGFDISRSGVSKIEARLSYVDDKTLLYLAEVLKVQLQELFPTRPPGNRIYDFIEKLETTRF